MTTLRGAGDRLVLRSGGTVFPPQVQNVDTLVAELVQKLPARLALLTETTGQVVSFHGRLESPGGAPLDEAALGALVAGDLAASQEIARLTGEFQDYQLILRQGRAGHLFISEVGSSFALLVQVSQEVPLGWARILILEAAQRMAEVLESAQEQGEAPVLKLETENLSGLLSSTLDSMWTEEADVR